MKKNLIYIFFIFSIFSFKKSERTTLNPASTIIVVPDNPNYLEMQAASAISKWLNVIYNNTQGFSIIKQSVLKDAGGKIIIAIGDTKFSSLNALQNLPPYSYIITREENVVTIAGNEYMSTLIGTGYFLDHLCGVRFYIPGDLFTSTPASKEIALDKKIEVKRIYNRIIFDEFTHIKDKLGEVVDLTKPYDVEWAPHPSWFYRISKLRKKIQDGIG